MNIHRNSTVLGTFHQKPMHRRWSWWGSLSTLAESPAIRRFSGFLLIVPFVVGLLDFIPGDPFKAPLSWSLGYLAAVFFLIGAILVGMWCPEIAKPHRTYTDFKREGRTTQYILQEAREVYRHYSLSPERANHFLRGLLGSEEYVINVKEFIDELPGETDSVLMDRPTVWTLLQKAEFRADGLDELFWYVKWFAAATDELKRFFCWLLFALGGLCAIGFLLVQIWTIGRHYLFNA